jgi:hypothetical protein
MLALAYIPPPSLIAPLALALSCVLISLGDKKK